jgi:hypothetical protein
VSVIRRNRGSGYLISAFSFASRSFPMGTYTYLTRFFDRSHLENMAQKPPD